MGDPLEIHGLETKFTQIFISPKNSYKSSGDATWIIFTYDEYFINTSLIRVKFTYTSGSHIYQKCGL